MITTNPDEFLEAFEKEQKAGHFRPRTMRAAMLVSPRGLALSAQSAKDNFYIEKGESIDLEKAHVQHQAVSRKISEMGVPVIHFAGLRGLDDGSYPNNVYGTIPGRFIIGKMFHQVRQQEANRKDVRSFFREVMGRDAVDLSQTSGVGELTGALVIDRAYNVGFCGLSNRADEEGCRRMHEAFDLSLTLQFELVPEEYHTNIVLAVLAGKVCVMHAESFVDPAIPETFKKAYVDRTASITHHEKQNFVANCIAVTDRDILMSARAERALEAPTREVLERNGFTIHGIEISELEKAGGSLRCLIAEIF